MTSEPAIAELRTTPPFRAGQRVDCRGWIGDLEPGVNPFGASGRERVVVADEFGIEYRHDPVTDIYYASPRFSQASLDREYQRASAHMGAGHFIGFDRAQWERAGHRTFHVSRLKQKLIAERLPPGARVLDVGCHVGLSVLLAQEAGYDAHGIDVSTEAIQIGAEHVGVRNLRAGRLEQSGYQPGSFDGLVIWDVLEHLYNLMEVMALCAALLRPGGWFFAQVPNHRGITARLKTLSCKLGLRGRRYAHFGFPWHLYHFSPRSLRLLVERAGLEPASVRSFSHRSKDARAGLALVRAVNARIERLALSDYLYIVARKPEGP